MRWRRVGGAAGLLLAAVVGCKQQVFLTEADHRHYQNLMPKHLEECPFTAQSAVIDVVRHAPSTVDDAERPIRYISLAEAVSIALEQGSVGSQQLIRPGGQFGDTVPVIVDSLPQFTGRGVTTTDAIRAFALSPAAAGTQIEAALSKFDAVLTASATWNATDRPIGSALDVFQAGQGQSAIVTEDASVNVGLFKPLASGGVAGISFRTDYNTTNLPAAVNPSYRPTLQFQFEQPLLQGFGVDINQIRPNHPGSILNPGVVNTTPTQEGIVISRLRYDQTRAEFERQVQIMVTNVEIAYWSLYFSYWNLYAQEQGLRQAFITWRIFNTRFQAGSVGAPELAQVRGQYERFRGDRLTALANVQEAERQLRGILNLHIEDGTRLVPCDEPTLAEFKPDWATSLQDAYVLQPVLYQIRQEIKANQLAVINARNQLMPDLRFTATHDFNSIGSSLEGAGLDNAFRALSDGNFSNSSVGLRLNVPIGFRNAHANLRAAQLQLAQTYLTLKDAELQLESGLALQYRLMERFYEEIKIRTSQREAYGLQLRTLFERVRAGAATADVLLEAQRFYTEALIQEHRAIRDYNIAMVTFEVVKGTVLRHNNINVAEGPLPEFAKKRAVEHFRERAKAIPLRERAVPEKCDYNGDCPLPPPVSPSITTALPHVADGLKPMPDPKLPPGPGYNLLPGVPGAKVTDPAKPAETKPAETKSVGTKPVEAKPAVLPPVTPSPLGAKPEAPPPLPNPLGLQRPPAVTQPAPPAAPKGPGL